MEKGVRGTCEGSLMAAPEAVGDRGVVEGQGWGERNREAERILRLGVVSFACGHLSALRHSLGILLLSRRNPGAPCDLG